MVGLWIPSFQVHCVRMASELGYLGSIDCNTGSEVSPPPLLFLTPRDPLLISPTSELPEICHKLVLRGD